MARTKSAVSTASLSIPEVESLLLALKADNEAMKARLSEMEAEKKASVGAKTFFNPVPSSVASQLDEAVDGLENSGEPVVAFNLVEEADPTKPFPRRVGFVQVKRSQAGKVYAQLFASTIFQQTDKAGKATGAWVVLSPNKQQRALDAIKAKAAAKAEIVAELVAEGWTPPAQS